MGDVMYDKTKNVITPTIIVVKIFLNNPIHANLKEFLKEKLNFTNIFHNKLKKKNYNFVNCKLLILK